MQVIQVAQFGGPEVLVPVEVPDPVAGRGQAVIGVTAAEVLFLDAMIRYGLATDFFPLRPPYVPGSGVAGTVISVGPDTDASWTGRRVVAQTGANGGYAQQAVVAAGDLIPVPEGLGLPEAAALLHDGATALGLVFDNVGGPVGLAAFVAIAAGGRFSAHGAPAGGFVDIDPQEAKRLGVTVRGIEQVQFAPADLARLAGKALSGAAEGLIRPIIGQTFPLEQAADAHRAIEARDVIGKTLLVT